jgi:hypothetical protein
MGPMREGGLLAVFEDRLLVPAAVNFAQPMLSVGVVGTKDDGELAVRELGTRQVWQERNGIVPADCSQLSSR